MRNLFWGWAGAWIPLVQLVRVLNEVLGFLICVAMFVAMMRMSAGPKPGLRYLMFGAIVGGTLFTIGRQLLAFYLSTAAVVSPYGAAGSLIVLLMWIYFCCCSPPVAHGHGRKSGSGGTPTPTPPRLRPALVTQQR